MLRTKFYLTDGTAKGPTAIYAACYLEGRRKKIYTPLTVAPDQWDANAQRFRRNFTSHPEANALLKTLVEELDKTHLTLTAKGKLTLVDDLKQTVTRVIGGAPALKPASVLDHLDAWIESSRRDKTPNTIRGYLTLRKHLLDYAKAKHFRLEFAAFDLAFCESFKTYLLRVADLTNTSINNHIKNIKVFLNTTFEMELHEVQHYKRFRKMEALEPEVVYLTHAEKQAIAALQLDYIARLEATRDVFLFECETGLRFSDVKALRPDQVYDDYLLLTTQKTSDFLKVPLSPLAKSIVKKYRDRAERALPAKSNQKMNADLKQLARMAKLTTPTTTVQLRGKDRAKTTVEKWKLITTHTARRTFVTLALEGGMRPEVVMRITGHKDYQTLHRYLKITDSVVKDEFAEYVKRQAA